MTDSLSQYCPNCEAQANTIEELRAANERWVIAFKQAEERAIDAVKALQAENARLREALVVLRDLPIVENDETDTLHLNGETHTGPVVDWLFYAVRKIKAVAEAALQETER